MKCLIILLSTDSNLHCNLKFTPIDTIVTAKDWCFFFFFWKGGGAQGPRISKFRPLLNLCSCTVVGAITPYKNFV